MSRGFREPASVRITKQTMMHWMPLCRTWEHSSAQHQSSNQKGHQQSWSARRRYMSVASTCDCCDHNHDIDDQRHPLHHTDSRCISFVKLTCAAAECHRQAVRSKCSPSCPRQQVLCRIHIQALCACLVAKLYLPPVTINVRRERPKKP